MKLQFKMSTIFLMVAVAAIFCSALLTLAQFDGRKRWDLIPGFLGFTAPIWIPSIFVGYAIGQKRLTVLMVIALVPIEAFAVGIAYLINRYIPA
jgi:hypothetical protein